MSNNSENDQKCRDIIIDELQRGLISADEANVRMVLGERIRLITKLSKEVRKALNLAVKEGRLCHMKKAGFMPEVYYHPDFKYLAIEARDKHLYAGIRALKSCF